jgi:hypothetical protein
MCQSKNNRTFTKNTNREYKVLKSKMKFSRAISRVKWLSGEQINVSKNIWQTSTLRTRTEMVFETLVCSPLNHMTQLIARENFIMLSRRESNKSHYSKVTLQFYLHLLVSYSFMFNLQMSISNNIHLLLRIEVFELATFLMDAESTLLLYWFSCLSTCFHWYNLEFFGCG